jgi:hypothetical protein
MQRYEDLSEDLKEIAKELHPYNFTEWLYKVQGVEIAFSSMDMNFMLENHVGKEVALLTKDGVHHLLTLHHNSDSGFHVFWQHRPMPVKYSHFVTHPVVKFDMDKLDPPVKTIKTYAAWENSGLDLDEYLQIGDVVDAEMEMYFLEVLPPACMTASVIQIGEPYSHRDGRATYSTLKCTPDGWAYAGHCFRGDTVNQP